MKITISKLLILLALVLAVPAIGGSAVLAQTQPVGPSEDVPTTRAAPTNEPQPEAAPAPPTDGGDGGGAEGSASSAAKAAVCEGVALTDEGCDDTADQGGLDDLISKAILVLSIIIGVVCVVMIMIGGLKYITSSGDANSLTSAKNTILYAIVGLVVVALAQTIVRYVLSWL